MHLELDIEMDHMPEADPSSPVNVKITDEGVWIKVLSHESDGYQEVWVELGDNGNLKVHCYRPSSGEPLSIRIHDDRFEVEDNFAPGIFTFGPSGSDRPLAASVLPDSITYDPY